MSFRIPWSYKFDIFVTVTQFCANFAKYTDVYTLYFTNNKCVKGSWSMSSAYTGMGAVMITNPNSSFIKMELAGKHRLF